MEATIECDYPNCLIFALLWHNRCMAYTAARGKFPWKKWSKLAYAQNIHLADKLLVEILYAMILVGSIDGEWYTIQALAADHAAKAVWMIRFAIRTQNSL